MKYLLSQDLIKTFSPKRAYISVGLALKFLDLYLKNQKPKENASIDLKQIRTELY